MASPASNSERRSPTNLDAIILKALRKAPDERYNSAQEFAADLRRHLDRLPVVARIQTPFYRIRSFAGRHRWGLAVGGAMLALLAAYAATVTVQSVAIRRALAQATTETRKAEQVTDFLLGLFEANEPSEALGDTITARELMNRGAASAEALAGQPEVQAQLLGVVGRVRAQLGLYRDARPALEQSLATRRRLLGERHPDVAESFAGLGLLDHLEGKYKESSSRIRQALAIQRESLGPTHAKTLETLFSLANTLHESGDHDSALKLFDEWITLQAILDVSCTNKKKFGEAEACLRKSLAMARRFLAEDHPQVINSTDVLARHLSERGGTEEAERLFRESLRLYRKRYGDKSLMVARTQLNLGELLLQKRDFAEAERMLLASYAMYHERRGASDRRTRAAAEGLAKLYESLGRRDEAAKYRAVTTS